MEDHITEGIERAVRLERKLDSQERDIKANANNIKEVTADLRATKDSFGT